MMVLGWDGGVDKKWGGWVGGGGGGGEQMHQEHTKMCRFMQQHMCRRN